MAQSERHRIYAHVSVDVEYTSQKCNVINGIGDKVNRNAGEVNAKTHPDWINVVIAGCRETLEYLYQQGNDQSYLIKITKVVGLEVDTTEDAMKVAAAIATWRAVNPSDLEPIPKFDGNWTVDFPPLL